MVGREKEPAPSPEELAALSGMPEVHQERTVFATDYISFFINSDIILIQVVIQSRPQSAQSHGDRTSNQWQVFLKPNNSNFIYNTLLYL
jgi:hypothetical protein